MFWSITRPRGAFPDKGLSARKHVNLNSVEQLQAGAKRISSDGRLASTLIVFFAKVLNVQF
jgi:hypothetical protein